MLRFHLPLVEPDVRNYRIRLSDGIREVAHAPARLPDLRHPDSSFRDR